MLSCQRLEGSASQISVFTVEPAAAPTIIPRPPTARTPVIIERRSQLPGGASQPFPGGQLRIRLVSEPTRNPTLAPSPPCLRNPRLTSSNEIPEKGIGTVSPPLSSLRTTVSAAVVTTVSDRSA